LRRVKEQWLIAFMALTGGLLTFLGVEALFEAFQLQAVVPGPLGGPGLVLLGVAGSFLTMTFISGRFSGKAGGAIGGVALATLVAIGIGLHNFGEGLAIGTSFSIGQLTLGSFLIIGFMVHNVTDGLGIAAPAADEGATLAWPRLVALTLIAAGRRFSARGWAASPPTAALFFGAAAGAFEVVAGSRFPCAAPPGELAPGTSAVSSAGSRSCTSRACSPDNLARRWGTRTSTVIRTAWSTRRHPLAGRCPRGRGELRRAHVWRRPSRPSSSCSPTASRCSPT
jgi:hypothetical protein